MLFMKFRNFLSSLHFIVIVSAALFIAAFGYLIARHYHYRFDFSEGKIYSLSPQSIQILNRLKTEPIHVYAFFKEESPLKPVLESLLKEYAFHHRKFHYQFLDPDRMPAKAKQYKIDDYDTFVIEIKGRQEKSRQVSEATITDLLSKLMSPRHRRIVFTAGYGGPALREEKEKIGYGLLRQKLIDSNYSVKETMLMRDGIAKGDDLLVLSGARVDLLPEELKLIGDFLQHGGNLLVLADPVNSGEGGHLERFLLEYGIDLTDSVVVDKLSKLFGADFLVPLITEYKPHSITKGFRMACFLSIARAVRKADVVPDGIEVTELAFTGAGSWAETDLKNLSDGKAEFDEKKDRPGPVPIAVAAEIKGKGRIVVIGDSDFASNAFLNLSGNKDFLLNSIAWLVGDEAAISIRPRERAVTPLYLKETDQQYIFYVPVMGLPILFLITGSGVFFWRRRFR